MIDLGIVVITHNSEQCIGQLLGSVPAAVGDLKVRTVVVDNASTDRTVAVARAFEGVEVLERPNDGYSAGFNAGVAACGEVSAVAVLNPDLTLTAGSLRTLVDVLGPRVGIAAPRVLDADGALFRSLRRDPSIGRATGLGFTGRPAFSEYILEPAAYDHPQEVDWALGAALVMSRACLQDVGSWDESFFLYSEETDFCLRARDRGWQVRYEPSAVVQHSGAGSGTSERLHAMQIVNRVRLYRRRRGPLRGALYYGLTLLSEATWLARGNSQSWTAMVALVRPRRRPAELRCLTVVPR